MYKEEVIMATKRSPRYPRLSLRRALDLARRLYDGAHQSKIDADTAARVIGYTNSSSGAAATALGSLRQFGLVDGLRGDLCVSDLAMRILQPMDDEEHIDALHEAANKPEVFAQVLRQFDGELPRSDAPVHAFLVRQVGFSQKGASEVVDILRETFADLPEPNDDDQVSSQPGGPLPTNLEIVSRPHVQDVTVAPPHVASKEADEVIVLPLGVGCRAEIRFSGEVTAKSYDRLLRHLELLKENLEAD